MAKPQLATRKQTPADFGMNLYYVRTTQKIAKEYEITIRADGYNIDNSGILTFYQEIDEETILNTLSLTPENYQFVYLASPQGQFPLAVERWNGVANVRTVEKEILEKKEVVREVAVKTNDESAVVVETPAEEKAVEQKAE